LDNSVKIKIEHEISRIEKLLTDSNPLISLCKMKQPDFIEITAMAQILHSFYNGIESVVVLFLKSINEKLPSDYKWHKTLLDIAFGQNSKNIKIFREEIKILLNDYMAFRHFIRHSYSSELEWEDMKHLVEKINEIWENLKLDFEVFLKSNSSEYPNDRITNANSTPPCSGG